ncbi:hypothetical protein OU798_23265 [Prolixibacteraceae bacterium Z1-6]|uniref:Lipoprotein n=1 Tax=Draconibacterium aestuarii TaxID=2998507 RepID=A0A9X3FA06_9BACT|nr:hypothetical protein [Prolixibacteraceae bacterium Z1-6]
MKTRNFTLAILLAIFLSGCVVYSFYPLYTEKDLFENDILLGEWFEEDNQDVTFTDDDDEWTFEHPFIGNKKDGVRDKKSYRLTLKSKENDVITESVFKVHVIELAGQYFLDFYIEDYGDDDDITLSTLHLIPVHTFAKLTVQHNDRLEIRWFDPEWLENLIKENKIRIHHENNGDFILLTARPKELQKFVTKYVDSEEAFKDGLEVELHRK